jgi:hypothetical protein
MVRKIGLVIIVLATDDPVTQSLQATCCVGFVMVLNFSLKPFIRTVYDTLDSAGCTLEVFVYLLGISVLNSSGDTEVVLLWVLLILCTLLCGPSDTLLLCWSAGDTAEPAARLVRPCVRR